MAPFLFYPFLFFASFYILFIFLIRFLFSDLSFMITIRFPDRDTEKRALAFLLGRFSGRVLRSGEHLVPEAALEALADQNISFSVQGKTTYEQQLAALRSPSTP
jgi:hypothetical protein